jgi:hypothetical protein
MRVLPDPEFRMRMLASKRGWTPRTRGTAVLPIRIFVGVRAMFKKVVRVGFVSVVLAVFLCVLMLAAATVAAVVLDDASRGVLCEKTVEGAIGGAMLGMLSALKKWYRVRNRGHFTMWRFRCVFVREVKGGFCAGALVGLLYGAMMLAK